MKRKFSACARTVRVHGAGIGGNLRRVRSPPGWFYPGFHKSAFPDGEPQIQRFGPGSPVPTPLVFCTLLSAVESRFHIRQIPLKSVRREAIESRKIPAARWRNGPWDRAGLPEV